MLVTKVELWQNMLARVHEVEEHLQRRDHEHSEQVARVESERDVTERRINEAEERTDNAKTWACKLQAELEKQPLRVNLREAHAGKSWGR